MIVAAAGQGTRLGGDVPKQFLQLNGRPLLAYSLLTAERLRAVDRVVIVMMPEWKSYIEHQIIESFGIRKVSAIVAGGQERQDSVAAGLAALPPVHELVAVHDAARPFFSPQLFERVVAGCEHAEACIPAIAPRDTIKQVTENVVVRTLPRETLRLAQTPQVFRRDALLNAFQHAKQHGLSGTDEAALIEAAGGTVAWVDGEESNLKITTSLDLEIAKIIGI
jgi:2-C-methyl-D-erythritol 4-phosphate cytidylyltransferase